MTLAAQKYFAVIFGESFIFCSFIFCWWWSVGETLNTLCYEWLGVRAKFWLSRVLVRIFEKKKFLWEFVAAQQKVGLCFFQVDVTWHEMAIWPPVTKLYCSFYHLLSCTHQFSYFYFVACMLWLVCTYLNIGPILNQKVLFSSSSRLLVLTSLHSNI